MSAFVDPLVSEVQNRFLSAPKDKNNNPWMSIVNYISQQIEERTMNFNSAVEVLNDALSVKPPAVFSSILTGMMAQYTSKSELEMPVSSTLPEVMIAVKSDQLIKLLRVACTAYGFEVPSLFNKRDPQPPRSVQISHPLRSLAVDFARTVLSNPSVHLERVDALFYLHYMFQLDDYFAFSQCINCIPRVASRDSATSSWDQNLPFVLSIRNESELVRSVLQQLLQLSIETCAVLWRALKKINPSLLPSHGQGFDNVIIHLESGSLYYMFCEGTLPDYLPSLVQEKPFMQDFILNMFPSDSLDFVQRLMTPLSCELDRHQFDTPSHFDDPSHPLHLIRGPWQFASTITAADLNRIMRARHPYPCFTAEDGQIGLPRYELPDEMNIDILSLHPCYIDRVPQILQSLQQHFSNSNLIGFDTEGRDNGLALIQISTMAYSVLVDVSSLEEKFHGSLPCETQRFQQLRADVLAAIPQLFHEKLIIGLSVAGDADMLLSLFPQMPRPGTVDSRMDLSKAAESHGFFDVRDHVMYVLIGSNHDL